MTLPKATVNTIVATFERAQQREGIDEYTMRMVKVMHEENEPLISSVMTLLHGFMVNDELEDDKGANVMAVRCITALGLMYDCMKTQAESDELSEMFLEDEENASS